MSRLPVGFHPEAVAEARSSRLWYADRNPAPGEAFSAELARAVESIAEHPERWREFVRGTRRYLLRVSEDSLLVLAIAHARRRPGYWKARLLPPRSWCRWRSICARPGDLVTRFGYDGAGNLTSVVDARGNSFRFSYRYDELERRIRGGWPQEPAAGLSLWGWSTIREG